MTPPGAAGAAATGAAGAAAAAGAAGAARAAGAAGQPRNPFAPPDEGPVPGDHRFDHPHDHDHDHDHDHPGDDHGHPHHPGPSTGVVATFLPGLEALSVLALLFSALAAGVYLLVLPLVQAADGGKTWSDYKNKVPQTRRDPFSLQRLYLEYQSWGHIILGLVAMLLALVVLGLWTAGRHKFWARSLAQAALVFGFCVVVYGILMRTGAIGGTLPSTKEIVTTLTVNSQSGLG